MYQDPTEKSVETKCEISQRAITLWGGNRTLYLVGKYSPQKIPGGPFIWWNMWPGQKKFSGPFIKEKKSAPLADRGK